jgi:diguanylate cyclase
MKNSKNADAGAASWREVWFETAADIRETVATVVDEHAEALAEAFYVALMQHADSARLLDRRLVSDRLRGSMAAWLRDLYVDGRVTVEQCLANQVKVGEAHARIGVSMDLIGRGARVLRSSLAARLAARRMSARGLAAAIQHVYEMMDLAVAAMNASYFAGASRIERTDEAYRIMFLGRDLRAERERQRSQLLEWAQQILLQNYWNLDEVPTPAQGAAGSQFGLWLQHKASILFEGAPEMEQIRSGIDEIENTLLPRLAQARAQASDPRPIVMAIHGRVESIKAMLGGMFDTYIQNQDGRDSVTKLLSRRYFPSVARREIELASKHGQPFSLLLVDLDHFSRIRGAMDEEAADLVLAQVADALGDSVRAGDFIFRVGDDRFAVLVVEIEDADVRALADEVRQRIEGLTLRGPSGVSTFTTASIGIASFDGHPDYQRLMERAEQALLEAKAQGRNQCRMVA